MCISPPHPHSRVHAAADGQRAGGIELHCVLNPHHKQVVAWGMGRERAWPERGREEARDGWGSFWSGRGALDSLPILLP